VLCAAAGEADRLAGKQDLTVEISDQSLVGRAISRGWHQVALAPEAEQAVTENIESLVPHSEIALPLRLGQRVFGALYIQGQAEALFDSQNAAVLQTMADQLAVAIENVSLLQELRDTVRKLQATSRHYTQESWQAVGRRTDRPRGYRHRDLTTEPLYDRPGEADRVWQADHPLVTTTRLDNGQPDTSTLAMPVKLRGQIIGVLTLSFKGKPPTADTVSLIEEVANRLALALENARLLEETRQRAERDHAVSDITARIRASMDVEDILQTAVRQLSTAMGAERAFVEVGLSTRPPEA
jgi:GAF domain-containing protein